ncbi:MAG: hydrogenase maturation protease [Planctomycetes bacterium]|nr:hydrogenase maturation protease [Planctomycetota bacterium]
MTEPAPVLVLGLGNLLLGDDGFGLALLEELRARHAGEDELELLDGGTLGTALLGALEGRRALLVCDAVAGERPGEVLRVDDPLARPARQGVGGHGANASGLLAAAVLTGSLPGRVVVVGAVPHTLATGIGLSAPLRAALPAAVTLAERVLGELRAFARGGAACTS